MTRGGHANEEALLRENFGSPMRSNSDVQINKR
jgi:hypothetical protein